ncbi:MAG TPA: peroxiredoxin [Candidatus Dormibacteraeota bacterium]|nr:peroxiredoxin [Candidatus Dormibacteraeota bacterium]
MPQPALESEAPDFTLDALDPDGNVRPVTLHALRGKWVVLFFYPADFSFVCPTEVRGFASLHEEFVAAGAVILGVSPDDIRTHRAWAGELGGLPYPLLSDVANEVAQAYGAAVEGQPRPDRATFVIDPDGLLLYTERVARNVGRGVVETLRILQALQTGRLCPADWHPGEQTFDPALDAPRPQLAADV